MQKHAVLSIRYSLYMPQSSSMWKIGRKVDGKEYQSKLFAAERLEKRRWLFKNITFPSLLNSIKNAPGVETEVHILTSSLLPPSEMDLLADIVRPYRMFKVISYEPQHANLKSNVADYANSLINGSMLASLRLDDDDALSGDFLSKLSDYMAPEFGGFVVSLCKGYAALLDASGKIVSMKEYTWRLGSAGLALINQKTEDAPEYSIYSMGDHTKIDGRCPVILDGRSPSLIRCFHDFNDSSPDFPAIKGRVLTETESHAALSAFSIDPRVWPQTRVL